MTDSFERRVARVGLELGQFTADDITENGEIAFDGDHSPNGRQSAIGAQFQRLHRAGYIEYADCAPVRSKAPHRKGGMNRVWQLTPAGRQWAANLLGPTLFGEAS